MRRLGLTAADNGSSPLTRGKHPVGGADCGGLRLIPAHAGKTTRPVSRSPPTTAHPRSRGENDRSSSIVVSLPGSSPLTRGKPRRISCLRRTRRLIPAHAGKTSARGSPRCACAAHPRSRGENVIGTFVAGFKAGSSPLTRGKQPDRRQHQLTPRLIPAHAGKTRAWCWHGGQPGAHPRSRGENVSVAAVAVTRPGSSPLTRGKRSACRRCRNLRRLIPAHAGKTAKGAGSALLGAAHPRSRGENKQGTGRSAAKAGSSPLTRGKPARRFRARP